MGHGGLMEKGASGVRRSARNAAAGTSTSPILVPNSGRKRVSAGVVTPESKVPHRPLKCQKCFSSDEDDTDDSIFRPPISPFELPNLQQKIFKYLGLEDWKRCRLVCSNWRLGCSAVVQDLDFNLNLKDKNRLMDLVFGNNHRKLWRNYSSGIFRRVTLPERVPLSSDMLGVFFEEYGFHIRVLAVQNGWTIEGLKMILFDKCSNIEELLLTGEVPSNASVIPPPTLIDSAVTLPKLKKIAFNFTNILQPSSLTQNFLMVNLMGRIEILNGFGPPAEGIATMYGKSLITDLLTIAPNLQVVECPNKRMKGSRSLCTKLASQRGCDIDDIETSFSKVNQYLAQKLFSCSHNFNPNLNRMNLYLRLNNRGMEKLMLKGYPLQVLDLHVRGCDKEGLINLLRSVGRTLKKLRITVDSKLLIDFKCNFFTALESIHLDEYAGDLGFIADIPKLNRLILTEYNPTIFLKRREPHPAFLNSPLECLTIEGLFGNNSEERQPRVIKRLSSMFPNIKELKVDSVTKKDLWKIYDCYPNLETLHIEATVSTTALNIGLSGFSEDDTDAILNEGYELSRFYEYEAMRKSPYIGNLKNLKKLTISGKMSLMGACHSRNQRRVGLHSLWIVQGVFNLKKLQSLKIETSMITSLELKQLIRMDSLIRLELFNCCIDHTCIPWARKTLQKKAMEFIY